MDANAALIVAAAVTALGGIARSTRRRGDTDKST
jgi:hypothetical protein